MRVARRGQVHRPLEAGPETDLVAGGRSEHEGNGGIQNNAWCSSLAWVLGGGVGGTSGWGKWDGLDWAECPGGVATMSLPMLGAGFLCPTGESVGESPSKVGD